jgi:type IV pilus assembly protein PilV
VGLLGLAGMQARGLNDTQRAYFHTQATELAYEIADKIRANRTQVASYVVTKTGLAAKTCPTSNNPCTACSSSATSCTAAQMVAKDLYDWNQALSATLPIGQGSIELTTDGYYLIQVFWDDDKDGVLESFALTARF